MDGYSGRAGGDVPGVGVFVVLSFLGLLIWPLFESILSLFGTTP